MSKNSLRIFSWFPSLCLVWLGLALFGCAAQTQSFPHGDSRPRQAEKPTKTEEPSPRRLASLRLTEQGRLLLESGKPDDAIRVLERAINLNPSNGQNYYYLSEAWLLKGNLNQAQEFNRIADLYLRGDPEWVKRVMVQKEEIRRGGK